MKHIIFLVLALAYVTGVFAGEKNVSINRDFGTLYGSLLTPDAGTETVALIIAGSGPVDRNGNEPQLRMNTNAYLYLAQALEKADIASLRYDKRAIGQSTYTDPAKIADVTFNDFVGDAAAWVDWLAAHGFKRVILIGHSEGSLIALLAAQQSKAVSAVVSLEGAGYPIGDVLTTQLIAQLMPDNMALLMQAEQIIGKLKQGELVADYPQELASLFNEQVQPYLISWMRYSPTDEIRKLTVPVLIINGDNDLQVSIDNAKTLKAAQPRARMEVISGMTHVLKQSAGKTLMEQMRDAYTNADIPIDPALAKFVVEFIAEL